MLNIKDLTVVFNEGTVNEKKAIDHLSLHLEPGDFVTIIGSNGAGKSTLLSLITGDHPQRGKHFSLTPFTHKHHDVFVNALKDLDIGLEDRLTTKVGTLSGGQRQALTLLMATLVKPQLLLLDEHTAALDPATSIKVMKLSERIAQEHHITTMMITHDMEDALKYGNRILMMKDGKIIADIDEETKKKMTVEELVRKFTETGEANDRVLLH